MKKFKIKSFCKINLSLKVLERLNNNYHNIRSVITFCNLFDIIKIYEIKGSKDKINFKGKFKNNINIKSNTITKVLSLLRKEKFLKEQAFNIDIKKNIPHGSGLGGGSSNAATLLNFFNKKMNLKIKKDHLYNIASQIGFDVPIILEKKNTFLIGKKNKILRLKKNFSLNILIVYPNIMCSTKKIYQKNRKFSHIKAKPNLLTSSKKKLIKYLIKNDNDLEQTVIKYYPQVGKVINFIKKQNGCYFSRITGSGSACIGIFSNAKTANYTKNLVKLKFPNYWCFVSKTI